MHPDAKDMHPINYGVADFGVDHDVKVSLANTQGEFEPKPIAMEDYDSTFELTPPWERKAATKWYSKDD